MAQYIQFQIGSEFSGEGFKAAQAATSTLNNSVRHVAGDIGKLTSALGGMDNAVGKAATAMTGMLNTFMTLNPVMIGITAAISALTIAYNEHKKAAEELKKQTDALHDSLTKIADSSNQVFTDAILTRIKETQKNFEQITKHANDMTAAMNGLANAQAQGGVISLQAEKLRAVMEESTAEARKLTAAEQDLRIATEKAAVARQQAQQQSDAAHQAVVNSQKELEHLEHQRASAVAAVKIMEERMAESKAKGLETEENDAKRLASLRSQIADIDSRTVSVKNRLEVELVNERTAAANLANATASAENEVLAAQGAIKALKDDMANAAEAERKLTAEKEAKAAQLKEEKKVRKEAADIQKKVNDGARELEKAERAYAAALAEYEKNYADNETANNIFRHQAAKGQLATPVRIDGTVKADIVSHDLKDAINNGLIKSVRDMDKFTRDRAKEIDKNEKKNWHQLESEVQRYERLQSQGRKSWSKADRDFAEKFETLKKAADAKVKEVADAKQRLIDEWNREKENWENLKEINKKLENLGLK